MFYEYATRTVHEVKENGQINTLTLVDHKGKSYIVGSSHYAYFGANCGSTTELAIYENDESYSPTIAQEWIDKPEDAFCERFEFTGTTTTWGNHNNTVALLEVGKDISLQEWWEKNMRYIGASSPSGQPLYRYSHD